MEILFIITFFIQNIIYLKYIVSKIVSLKISVKYIYLLGILNVFSGLIWLTLLPQSIFRAYLFLTLFYCIEICLFYKGPFLAKISIGLIMIIHLTCISTIIVSIISLIIGKSMNYIINNFILLTLTRIITFVLCIFIMFLFLKIIPTKYWKIITLNHKETKIFLVLEISGILCLIAGAFIYNEEILIIEHVFQELILGLIWFIVEYIGIFIIIGFDILEEHKIHLENKLQLDKIYKNALIKKSDVVIQVNCQTGAVISYIFKGLLNENSINRLYDNVILELIDTQIHPNDRAKTKVLASFAYMLQAIEQGINQYSYEYRFCEKYTSNYEWFKVDVIIDKDNILDKITALVMILNIQPEKDLLFKAQIDALSHLYNKTTTQTLIQNCLHQEQHGVLFMIDVDNFKSVNDKLGHDKGDAVIEDVAQELTHIFNKNDIIGRVGGDEFMVFLKAKLDKVDIRLKATEICKALNKTYSHNNIDVTISASVGIVNASNNIKTFQELYCVADKALYNSKNNGKNTFTIYNSKLSLFYHPPKNQTKSFECS
ncbi:hypothetical protein AN642_00815 [Epulopiscium sp. SCG-B10WGA-EpuloA2]|nr:hypothetical protein AN642_00815 [Epulopiscium sp. SCG-B10WGA-EpuloA2]